MQSLMKQRPLEKLEPLTVRAALWPWPPPGKCCPNQRTSGSREGHQGPVSSPPWPQENKAGKASSEIGEVLKSSTGPFCVCLFLLHRRFFGRYIH